VSLFGIFKGLVVMVKNFVIFSYMVEYLDVVLVLLLCGCGVIVLV